MRKVLGKIFLLCLACVLCMQGLCLAEENNLTLMWTEENINDIGGEKFKYYIDESKTKVIDYEGRKYLQVYYQRNKVFLEQIWFVMTYRETEKAHWTVIYDVGQQKRFILDSINKDSHPKEKHRDISDMKQYLVGYSGLDKKFMAWMAANRKSILDEINKANGNSGSTTQAAPPITAGGDWNVVQTLEDGPVQFNPRTVPGNTLTVPVMGDGITHMYVSGIPESGIIVRGWEDRDTHEIIPDRKIQIDSQKPLYMIYSLDVDTNFVGMRGLQSVYEPRAYYMICAVFDYEEATNTFTIYGPRLDEENIPGNIDGFNLYFYNLNFAPYDYTYVPLYSVRLIDRNTVEVDSFWDYAPPPGRYEYRKFDNGGFYELDYQRYPGYAWVLTDVTALRERWGSEYWGAATDDDIRTNEIMLNRLIARVRGYYEIGVDGLFAFLARKGNVGHAPSEVSHLIGRLSTDYLVNYHTPTP